MSALVDVAMDVAVHAHGAQVNKHDGEPYIAHPLRVWRTIRDLGPSWAPNAYDRQEIAEAVALLHDVLEDCPEEYPDDRALRGELMLRGVGHQEARMTVDAVDVMTKVPGESNREYYHRVKGNAIARHVKLRGDIVDNFRRNHRITDPDTQARLAVKYALGVDILS